MKFEKRNILAISSVIACATVIDLPGNTLELGWSMTCNLILIIYWFKQAQEHISKLSNKPHSVL